MTVSTECSFPRFLNVVPMSSGPRAAISRSKADTACVRSFPGHSGTSPTTHHHPQATNSIFARRLWTDRQYLTSRRPIAQRGGIGRQKDRAAARRSPEGRKAAEKSLRTIPKTFDILRYSNSSTTSLNHSHSPLHRALFNWRTPGRVSHPPRASYSPRPFCQKLCPTAELLT